MRERIAPNLVIAGKMTALVSQREVYSVPDKQASSLGATIDPLVYGVESRGDLELITALCYY